MRKEKGKRRGTERERNKEERKGERENRAAIKYQICTQQNDNAPLEHV